MAVATATDRTEKAHEVVGDTGHIEQVRLDLDKVDNNGAFIEISTAGFKSLDRQLSWKALGITPPDGLNISLRSPHIGLLPDTYRLPLLRPAGKAYEALARWSLDVGILDKLVGAKGYRFIPWSAWEKFKTDFDEALVSLDVALQAVEDNYPSIQAIVVQDFTTIVRQAATRMSAAGALVEPDFEERMITSLEDLMPTPDGLRKKLQINFRVAVLTLGSSSLEEQRRATEERRRLEAEREQLRLEENERQVKESIAWRKDQAERDRLELQMQAERDALQRKIAAKQELDNLKLNEARKRMDEALSPIDDGLKQLRAVVYEAVSALSESLKKNGYLHGSSAKKARDLAEYFTIMNDVFGDTELEAKIARLESLASTPIANEKRDIAPLENALGEIKELTAAAAREAKSPGRFDALQF